MILCSNSVTSMIFSYYFKKLFFTLGPCSKQDGVQPEVKILECSIEKFRTRRSEAVQNRWVRGSFEDRSSWLFNLTFEGPSNRQIRTRSKVVQVDLSNWHSKQNRVESSMFFCSSFQFLLQMDRVAENSITCSKPFDRAPQNFDLCLYVIETRLSHIFSPTPSARKNFLSKHNLKKFLEIALPSLISQKFGGRWRVALITLWTGGDKKKWICLSQSVATFHFFLWFTEKNYSPNFMLDHFTSSKQNGKGLK